MEKRFLAIMQSSSSGTRWLSWRPASPTCLCAGFSGSRTDMTSKGSFIHQHLWLLMRWGLFLFFPSGSDPPCCWCILKSPADYFPLSPFKFWMRWKKKETSFLCCRNDEGNSFHMCPGAGIVKTDLVLSPSHRCGWFFSGEVTRRELKKLIWVFLSSSISCQDLLRKKKKY